MKPVYMINGFLESGKTEFITFTLEQPYFQIKGKTLIIRQWDLDWDWFTIFWASCALSFWEDKSRLPWRGGVWVIAFALSGTSSLS